MNDLIAANQLCEVTRAPNGWCYHIPHHSVLKKFRIVFDASCRTDLGLSLNETQLVGEKLQDDLFDLIMRFLTFRIGITADIQKMYLQVGIHSHQWDLQRVFWRSDSQAELKEYWLTSVIFGMASAPHCAVRAMQQCAEDEGEQFPQAAKVVTNDFYMDDCLTSEHEEPEAAQLCNELGQMLARGGFVLSKWHSNVPNILPSIISTDQAMEPVELSDISDTTVLGLRWLPSLDELAFKFQPLMPDSTGPETMRQVLRSLCSEYTNVALNGMTAFRQTSQRIGYHGRHSCQS